MTDTGTDGGSFEAFAPVDVSETAERDAERRALGERLAKWASAGAWSEARAALDERMRLEHPIIALHDACATMDAMVDDWEHPTPATSTALVQLDALLAGGLRPGDMLALGGRAGGGKSAFACQIALNAASQGAAVVYASVEMPASEVVSRWLACLAFRCSLTDERKTWAISSTDVLHGRVWRYEDATGNSVRDSALAVARFERLNAATEALRAVGSRLFAVQVQPGSTVDNLAELVASARARASDVPVVLMVDPLQRFFAAERGELTGSALGRINASETERVGLVAQQLKWLADTAHVSVLFCSDTTKAAKGGSSDDSLRGSYQLNHLATIVLGITAADDPAALRKVLGGGDDESPKFARARALAPELTADAIHRAALPSWWASNTDVADIGRRVVALECSKNRRGAMRSMAFAFVAGASAFFEGTVDADPTATPPRRRRLAP